MTRTEKKVGGEKKRGEALEMLALRIPTRLKLRVQKIRGIRQGSQAANISVTDLLLEAIDQWCTDQEKSLKSQHR